MKKIALYGMIAMLAFTAAACGKKNGSSETTVSAGAVESSEAVGENTINATVQKIDGNSLTVELDDGQSMNFDISNAELSTAWDFMPGDEVEIGYDGEDPADGMAVRSVVMSVPFEYMLEDYSENTTLYGLIEAVDDNSISVRELLDERSDLGDVDPAELTEEDFLGDTYTFTRAPYETVVTADGVNTGVYASITYIGSLDSNPISFHIVTEDMEDEDDVADETGIKGQVEKVEQGVIYLKASDDTTFKFQTSGDHALVQQANSLVGKEVIVNFSDSLASRVATADSIEEVK